MNRRLSKSQYTRGLQCQKSLWLYRHKPELRTPINAYDQLILDQGTEFGILARQRFPGGTLIEADHQHPEDALNETQRALTAGAKVLYEAAIEHDGILVRVDIMAKNDQTGQWDLYEVKSSTKVKEEHLDDVAVQAWVLNGAGFNVGRYLIIHANPDYVRMGKLDLGIIFSIVDLTLDVKETMLGVPNVLAALKATCDAEQPLEPGIGAHCSKPHDCDFKAHCWAHVPKYSVFNLAYAKMDVKMKMWNSGVQRIDQINPGFHKLTAGQVAQVTVAKAGKPHIDKKAISGFLAKLNWPRYFLDFETDNPVIPPYDGLSPYQQMPFQASLRIQESQSAVPTAHFEFIDDGRQDPREELIKFLLDHAGRIGSIVAYHKSFEGGRIEELATWAPNTPARDGLLDLVQRLWDLADPFRTGAYVHPAFEGKWSIKSVLPVLVPDLSYKGLAIADGTGAMTAYKRLRSEKMSDEARSKIVADLKVYCGLDTEAMVRILDHVEKVVAGEVVVA